MRNIHVAIAISVYKSDQAEHLKLCIDSMLNQSYQLTDIFLQVDGVISDECYQLLNSYSNNQRVLVTYHDDNKGLATRLNNIIDDVVSAGKYTYIARMDADDISFLDRIAKQVEFLEENSDISVLGTDLIEISDTGEELFHKKMNYSHYEIAAKVIKKCPFSHPTVMFREAIFKDGDLRYKSELMNTQDYYLWVDLLAAGHKFANLDEPLLYFRVNDDFHSRRGWAKAMNDLRSRLYAFKYLDVTTPANILHTGLLFLLRVAPASLKSMAYRHLR